MKFCVLTILTSAFFLLPGESQPLAAEDLFPSESKISSPEIKKAIDRFEKEKQHLVRTYQSTLADLQTKYQAAVVAAQTKLKDRLEKVRQEATIQNQLDDAVAIRDAIGEAEQLSSEPPSLEADSTANPMTPPEEATTNAPSQEKKSLAEMSIKEIQQALAGKWQANTNSKDIWLIHPNGTLDYTENNKVFRNLPLSFRYLNGKVFISRFHDNGHYSLYVTQDFQMIDNTYGNKFKLRKISQEDK